MSANGSTPPEVLTVLAHEVRWQIVQLLAQSDRRVQEIVRALAQPQNFVSYHLKQLRQAQVVTEHRSAADGRDIYYHLDLDTLSAGYRQLGLALHPALAPAAMHPWKIPPSHAIRVLFLCSKNSARSQMAEGLLRHYSQGWIETYSAGTEPATLHPLAVQAMDELGIDIRQQWAKPLADVPMTDLDYVVTVCDRAREHCPEYPASTRLIHWSIPDPVADTGTAVAAVFVATANELALRIHYLLTHDATCFISLYSQLGGETAASSIQPGSYMQLSNI